MKARACGLACWTLLAAITAASQPDPPPPQPSVTIPGGAPLARRVEASLADKGELRGLHRGYWRFVNSRPALYAAESAWWTLHAQAGLDMIADDYVEALARHPDAAALAAAYAEATVNSPATVPGTSRTAQAVAESTALLEGMRQLSGMVAAPAAPLSGEGAPTIPPALQPYLETLSGQPNLLDALRRAPASPLYRQFNEPGEAAYWRVLAVLAREDGGKVSALAATLAARPAQAAVWHARERAWVAENAARPWMEYTLARLRRAPELGGDYLRWLAWLAAHPAQGQQLEARWAAQDGAAPAWPPAGAPPVLAPLPASASRPVTEKKVAGSPERGTVPMPAVDQPAKPNMPHRPTAPERPAKPTLRTFPGYPRTTTD